jgi:hypothetical protein
VSKTLTNPKLLVLSGYNTNLSAAGYGYTFFSPEIRDFGLPVGLDEFSGLLTDMEQPITIEPGTNWQYGVSERMLYSKWKTRRHVPIALFANIFPRLESTGRA